MMFTGLLKTSCSSTLLCCVCDCDEHQPEILGHIYRDGLEVRVGVNFPVVLVHEHPAGEVDIREVYLHLLQIALKYKVSQLVREAATGQMTEYFFGYVYCFHNRIQKYLDKCA